MFDDTESANSAKSAKSAKSATRAKASSSIAPAAVVEAIVDTSEAYTRPVELVPAMALALVEVSIEPPSPVLAPKTAPPHPPPMGATLLEVIHVPVKPPVVEQPVAVAVAAPAVPQKRSRVAMISGALACAAAAVIAISISSARGDVAHAPTTAAAAAPTIVASAPPAFEPRMESPAFVEPTIAERTFGSPASFAPPVAPVVEPAAAPVVEPAAAPVAEPAAAPVAEPAAAPPAVAPSSARAAEPRVRSASRKQQTLVTIVSEPSGASVIINGKRVGTTPLVANVERDKQATIWFHANGMASDWRRILPKQGKANVHISMRPAQ